jgi:myo-inositol-1(or 4)-monophosphatase
VTDNAPDSLLDRVSAVAAEAGALAMSYWRGDYEQWEKSPGDPVSEVDLEVDRLLFSRLRAMDPEAGWLSEETVDNAERLMCSRVWLVDPIDGTRDFVRGRRGWAVSIALVEGGRPLLGVLDAPARGEHWKASAGQGAFLNNVRLTASQRLTLPGARVPTDVLPKVDSDLAMVERPNSIALRIAMVGSDAADLVATLRWGHEWDIAAAILIAAEAGARVSDAHGNPLAFNSTKAEAFGVLVASHAIHPIAVARLRTRAEAAAIR